jgi:hypothetical protein
MCFFYRSRRTEKIPINKREKTLCMKGYYMKAGQIPNINDNNAIYVSRDIRRSSSCLSPESGTFYALKEDNSKFVEFIVKATLE